MPFEYNYELSLSVFGWPRDYCHTSFKIIGTLRENEIKLRLNSSDGVHMGPYPCLVHVDPYSCRITKLSTQSQKQFFSHRKLSLSLSLCLRWGRGFFLFFFFGFFSPLSLPSFFFFFFLFLPSSLPPGFVFVPTTKN